MVAPKSRGPTPTGALEILLNITPIEEFYWMRQCKGHTESLLVSLAHQPSWLLWENENSC